ncbi:inner ear-specific collagen-like [Myripristis murdjan]|uniref:inner ear-specific collagen-like n=1 Tax=Myripristis murdjan TaxID=586833 RepID=UPI001175F97E|nr:inner ear-specific collagen-like [Myripristis murdjan]
MQGLIHFLLGMASLTVVMAMTNVTTHPGPPNDSLTPDMERFCHMLLESPEPVPPEHMPWFCACSYCKGSQGPKGDPGDRGLPGPPGTPGGRGPTGPRGPPGFTGRPGIKGQKGDEGEKGARGPEGSMGPKGDRGFKGDKGEPGLEGRPGDPGMKGDEGMCPDTCESSKGEKGQTGLPGPAGPRGDQGMRGTQGSKGSKGDTGDAGAPGTPGTEGQKGEQGIEGDCNCQDGHPGSQGPKGDKGDQGDQGDQGSVGDKGSQGEKGDMGLMGQRGLPGPCMPAIQSSFSVGLTENFPPPNTPVIFSRVFNNVQGHFNTSSGLYTAPINGTYVFSYHLSVYRRILKVGLFHNFFPVVRTTNIQELGTTSHQLVLHLARGDRVWLQVKDETTNGMSALSESSSTFSGFLLHPDRCDMIMLRERISPEPTGGYSWNKTTPAPPTSP